MRERFIRKRFRDSSLAVIEQANEICADYQAQGFNLTLRQLYYQFVARGLLANSDRNYKTLGGIVSDARLAGLMDWSYLEDRTRNVAGNFAGYADPGQYLDSVADRYIEAIWADQFYRPEVWVEKEALADVVSRATGPDRVPYFSCRGYVSQSEMYGAAKRMRARNDSGFEPVVIHLGDHDPSGLDMTRDIRERLTLMARFPVTVKRVALNEDQIRDINPPPNPAKISDSRGQRYIAEHGEWTREFVGSGSYGEAWSWELDAIDPAALVSLIQDTIDSFCDRDALEAARAHESEQEDRIREVAQRFEDLSTNWDAVLEVIES